MDGGKMVYLHRMIKKVESNIFSLATKIKDFKTGLILMKI